MLIKKDKLQEIVHSLNIRHKNTSNTSTNNTLHTQDYPEIQHIQQQSRELQDKEQQLQEQQNTLNAELKQFEQDKKDFEELQDHAMKVLENLEKEFFDNISQLQSSQSTIIKQSQPEIIELITQITGSLIQQEVISNPDIIKNLINQALETMRSQPGEILKLILKVHPDTLNIATEYINGIQDKYTHKFEIQIAPDDNITPGSCVLDSSYGSIDLNFENQLKLFKEKMSK